MADTAASTIDLPTVPRRLRAERNEALHPVLRRLPHEFIVALIEGLGGADVIEPGRLFAGRSGGCAVGVTLRRLVPNYRGRRLWWGSRARKSVFKLRRSLAIEVPYLYALEQVFDRSVELAQALFPGAPPGQVANAVALWVADEARAELVLREIRSEWLDRAVAELGEPLTRLPEPVPVFA